MKKTLNPWNAWACPASALLLLPALHLPRALAQPSAAADTLPPVTVHATGLGLRADEMAAPVSVLDGTWWQMRQASTLGESLEGELGIQSSHFGAGASRPIIRGLDGPRVGVLSNGRELHDASTFSPDHRVVTEPLLSEGVEILRGPSALVHGGAVGGVVNVLDRKIPVQRPDKPVQGEAAVQWSSADRGRNAAMGLTTGQGPWVIRVEAAGRDAQDYRAGQGAGQVVGSATDTASGSVGLSYVTDRGHLGASYTRYQAQYGLPGHAHAHCHLHGSLHIHCHSHAHGDGEAPPQVDMHSHRWDVQGLLRQPLPGIASVDFSASHTRYSHDEQEEGIVATAFRNRAHELRLNVQHEAIAGWRGRVGVSQSRRNFGAQGEEAYVPPSTTLKQGVYLLEELRVQDWSLQAAVRHDRQTVRAAASGQVRTHHGNSASLGAVWHLQPSLQATASYSHAARLPSAEELLADGMHMATNAWEIGNPDLKKETSNAWDLGLRRTAGDTTWSVNVFHHRIQGYIYARPVDADHGVQLQHLTQSAARLTGLEAQVRQRIHPNWGVTVFGDTVHAKLDGGARVPRLPAARLGVRADAHWQGWEAHVEWVQTLGQHRVAEYETPTAGFGLLHLRASYQLPQRPIQLFVKAENLGNRLAYAHTSAIKQAAPLKGRNICVGMRVAF